MKTENSQNLFKIILTLFLLCAAILSLLLYFLNYIYQDSKIVFGTQIKDSSSENTEINTEMDVFENETEGYRFSYPRGWKAELRDGKVLLTSVNQDVVITASVKDQNLELSYESKQGAGLDELEAIGLKIKESFQMTEAKEFDKAYINQRYLETSKTEGN